ncbi:hypothetical protein Tco_0168255 [Tanacetum coccineum]
MGTKVTSSSGSVLEEPEIQKLQMQAKILKENSLNKLNALKSTTQLLERQSILYQQAFAQLSGDSVRTFKFQLSQHMNNLETLLNEETLHEVLPSESRSTDTQWNSADERAAHANFIANLSLDTEENKTILKQLKTANKRIIDSRTGKKECITNLMILVGALGRLLQSG